MFIISMFTINFLISQNEFPEGISYQAVIRDSSGNVLSNQAVVIRFNILNSLVLPYIVYSEEHNTTTNSLGIVNLTIGQGVPLVGSFNDINWSSGRHYLQVAIDVHGSGNFTDIGTTELLSVPYAFYAKKSGDANLYWESNGDNIFNKNSGKVGIGTQSPNAKLNITDTSEVLLRIDDKYGRPVLVAYQDSLVVYIPSSSTKTNKGAFIINPKMDSGKNSSTAGFFRVTPDSISFVSPKIEMLAPANTGSGFIMPQLSQEQIANITNPPSGMMVFNTTTGCLQMYVGVTPSGFLSQSWQYIWCVSNCSGAPSIAPVVNAEPYNQDIQISFNSVPGATVYYIDISTDINFTNYLYPYHNYNNGSNTFLYVTGLNPGTYYIKVRACNNCGCIESDVTTVTIY